MWNWLEKRSLTFKFEAFFTLSIILPLVLIGWFLFSSAHQTFTEKKDALLSTTTRFLEDSIRDNYHELELSSHQFIDLHLRKDDSQKSLLHKTEQLSSLLHEYKKSNKFDVVYLVNNKQETILNIDNKEPFSGTELKNLMLKCITKKRVIYGFKRFRTKEDPNYHITYMLAYPIINDGKVIGALLTGRSILNDPYFRELAEENSQYILRIITKVGSDYKLEYSNNAETTSVKDKLLRKELLLTESNTALFTTVHPKFLEVLGGQDYSTQIISLSNKKNEPLSFLLVSFSHKKVDELENKSRFFIGAGFITLLLLLIAIGFRVQRSFVTPINRLRLVAKQVIQGDLSQRIELSGSHDEITETLTVFNEMLDELQETQKKRNTFIATLTHDMKTPLIAQKNVLSIFENEFKQLGKNELARLSNSLVKNNISMLGMIEMLLDVEKYREGKVQLCFENIQAEDFIDQCVEKLTSLAKEKNILIESTINQNASSFIADPKQLERVLTNLVVNAIENIPEKSKVTITLSSIGNSLLMKVCDNGQGLDPELQDVIFDKYVSGEKKAQKIGSGLGLYICKLIVSLHKGSIEIKPNPEGRGTCFIVMLPQNASL